MSFFTEREIYSLSVEVVVFPSERAGVTSSPRTLARRLIFLRSRRSLYVSRVIRILLPPFGFLPQDSFFL